MSDLNDLISKSRHFLGIGDHFVEVSEKKWGTEYIISRSPHACKIMVVPPGTKCSLHFHETKTETFLLISGTLVVEPINQSGVRATIKLFNQFDSITLPRLTPHTFYAEGEEPAVFIEASTPDYPNDSFRIYPSQG